MPMSMPGRDGVVEEHRVHGLAHRIVAAERERQVGNAARDARARTGRLDARDGLDEILGVAVVLFHAGGDGQHVGIEDDVARIEAGLIDQQAIGALADLPPGARR